MAHKQIIKTRDDRKPVSLECAQQARFKLMDNTSCSWAKKGETLGTKELRPRIEPWLTALAQSEHLSLLIGSGLTHAVLGLAEKKEQAPSMESTPFETMSDEIEEEVKRIVKENKREPGNFEDRIRAANELLRGLDIIKDKNASALRENIKNKLKSFSDSILKGEHALLEAGNGNNEKLEKALNYLINFLMSFSSRSGTRERLHLFTTNYDRFIELGADLAGLRLIDRFVGILTPVFRASRLEVDMHYDPPGIRGEPRYLEGVARFTKLHGSLDWLDNNRMIRRIGLPFGARDTEPYLTAAGTGKSDALSMMIYPNAAKDRETTDYPYVELFRDFATSLCRPNNTLICYGYGFGDQHINRVINDMLTIPSTHLVVISYDDPHSRIISTYKSLGRDAQITLMIGSHLGDLQTLVDHYLPKPAIDRVTSRMTELIKSRLDSSDISSHEDRENKEHQQYDSASF